jgi:hypothetical protein
VWHYRPEVTWAAEASRRESWGGGPDGDRLCAPLHVHPGAPNCSGGFLPRRSTPHRWEQWGIAGLSRHGMSLSLGRNVREVQEGRGGFTSRIHSASETSNPVGMESALGQDFVLNVTRGGLQGGRSVIHSDRIRGRVLP